MTCPNCGSNMRDGARICLECGEVVRAKVAPGSAVVADRIAGVPSWIALETEKARSIDMGAGRAPRFFAYALDCIILGMVIVPAYLFLTGGSLDATVSRDGSVDLNVRAWIGAWIIQALYAIVLPASELQATPGKKMVGLRIVNASTGQRANIGQTTIRAVAQALFLGGLPLVAFGMIAGSAVFPQLAILSLLLPITIPAALIILVGGGSSPWDAVAGTRVLE